jgi:segregation and condensation protein A
MKPEIKLEQFSGPLDLLLSLIKDNKCDISKIALSEVTEQYLQYLDKLEENKDEELADFLVVGTRLLFLKSRMLLPQFAPEEEDGVSLEQQLRLYKAFVDASRKINKLWLNRFRSTFRVEPPRKQTEFLPPTNFSTTNMHQSLLQLIKRLRPLAPLPQTQIDRAISLKERIDKIRKLIITGKKIDFFSLLENAQNRTEVIVSFLALLELVKQKTIMFTQENTFSDISIEKI